MKPRIETISEKKLVGMKQTMSFSNYKVSELWQAFMLRRMEITNNLSNDFISMVIYKPNHFINFQPTNEFERWATVEVSGFDCVPDLMDTFTLPGGLYAVFRHKGNTTEFGRTFQYIMGVWLPNSNYVLDNRPHFEVFGNTYKKDDPDSEEEIGIPIRER